MCLLVALSAKILLYASFLKSLPELKYSCMYVSGLSSLLSRSLPLYEWFSWRLKGQRASRATLDDSQPISNWRLTVISLFTDLSLLVGHWSIDWSNILSSLFPVVFLFLEKNPCTPARSLFLKAWVLRQFTRRDICKAWQAESWKTVEENWTGLRPSSVQIQEIIM